MNKTRVIGGTIVAIVILATGLLVPMFVEKIDTGNVGIVYSPSGGVQKQALSQGWHIVGLFDKVVEYPTKLRTIKYDNMTVATKDGKNIQIDISYTYKVDPTKAVDIFNEFGNVPIGEIESGYLLARMLDAARQTVSGYNLLDVYGEKSSEAGATLQQSFEQDVKKLGFIVSDVVLGSPKPDKKTQQAIDERINASQENERKKIELESARIEADRKRVEAQGEADSQLIKAKAEAQANREIAKSLSNVLVNYEQVKKWNGEMPMVTGDSTPIISLPETSAKK